MITAEIKEARQRLTEYLSKVQKGDLIREFGKEYGAEDMYGITYESWHSVFIRTCIGQ
ncbi:MAG: hypothetical protein HZA01_09720 [Nitrospinae bacterium]|nr:hypothetical protein [Nitrospinota bacterium]